jgi:hypothetical protein
VLATFLEYQEPFAVGALGLAHGPVSVGLGLQEQFLLHGKGLGPHKGGFETRFYSDIGWCGDMAAENQSHCIGG